MLFDSRLSLYAGGALYLGGHLDMACGRKAGLASCSQARVEHHRSITIISPILAAYMLKSTSFNI